MSKKSTKIIAAAGVVAGLGVAALPAMTFATQTIKGGVTVKAQVNEAIAMTITGNDDVTWQTSASPAVSVTGDSIFAPSGSTEINSYDTANGEVFVNGTTDVRYASGSKIELLPNTLVNGNGTNGFKSEIKVYTNSPNGYTLTLIDADATNTLVLGENVDTIAPVAAGGDLNTGLGASNGAWGFKVGTASDDGTGYTAVPVSTGTAADIVTDGAAYADGETTQVYYGVSTKSAQKSGLYTDQIIYTAATKNA